MPDSPRRDRPSAEYSLVGGKPRLADMVLGKVGPTKRQVPPPVPVHLPRNQRTLTGGAPPPMPDSAPAPPVPLPAPELDSTLESPVPAPVSMVPLPFDDAERPTYNRAVKSAGGKIEPAEITPVPETKREKAPNSIMAAADKMPLWKGIALLTAAFGGATTLVHACGNEGAKLIEAWKPVSNVELGARVSELEKLGARVGDLEKARADGLETKARIEADAKHDARLDKHKARLDRLEKQPRVETVQGLAE